MALEKFHYTSRAGDEITLPWFKNLPLGVVEDAEDLPDEKNMKTILRALLGDDYEKIRRLELSELDPFIEAWMQKGLDAKDEEPDVTLGESSAS